LLYCPYTIIIEVRVMPTYEYECRSCGAGFDVFQSMSDAPLQVCPTCGKDIRRKINGGTGIIFKGSGFYKNDNRKADSSQGDSSSKSGSPKTESKSESKSEGKAEGKSATPAPASSSSSSEAPKKEAT
jgi:putative FmdB family regulatory protein